MAKSTEYKQKGVTVSIKFTSRASIKVNESFYTVEACEERMIPEDADVEKERKLLWDTVNEECDNQIQDILHVYGK